MRVALLYNEDAGEGVTLSQLRESIQRHGHELVGAIEIEQGIEPLLEARPDDRVASSPIEQALWKYHQVLSRLKPERWTVVVDGVRTTGDFLLVEVLNIPSVGPNLELSTRANPSDGMFSVVMAEEDDREALARYLRRRVDAPGCPPSFVTSHGRHVTLDGGGPLHVDDRVLAGQGPVSIGIHPAALEVLV